MDLEDRLREALHDPSWDLSPWPDPETRVRAALRRRRRAIGAAVLAVVVAAGVGAVAVVRVGGQRPGDDHLTPAQSTSQSAAPTPSATPPSPRTLVAGLGTDLVASVGGAGLYVSYADEPAAQQPTTSRVARVDTQTGDVVRSPVLDGPPGRPVHAGSTLLVPAGAWLYRLDRASLTVLGRTALGATRDGTTAQIAVFRDMAWVSVGGDIVEVRVADGGVLTRVTVSSGYPVSVAAGDDGRLYVGVGSAGGEVTEVQQRDAATGGLLTRSEQLHGIATPTVVGTTADGVWVRFATGMLAQLQRLSLPELKVVARYPSPLPNSSSASLASSLWVDSHQSITCADPTSGVPHASITTTDSSGTPTKSLLAVDERYVYLWTGTDQPTGGVARVPIPTGCGR